MKYRLLILLFCLFVVMTGYGLTLPVLPFYIERMAVNSNATTGQAAFQVGFLTGIFSLMQFIFAPLWGKWSDRTGRRPLFLIGLLGYAASMAFFALGTNLTMLYAARVFGGILSAAILPIAGAFVADMTSEGDRARGMAWLGSATSLGVVLGPALGSFLSKWGIRHSYHFRYFALDDFSIPFFSAAILALLALGGAALWFPESLKRSRGKLPGNGKERREALKPGQKTKAMGRWLGPLLAFAFLNYFALAIFEGTFALHAKILLDFGPFEMGWIFVACGLVMAVAQSTLVPPLIDRLGEKPLLPFGFFVMGTGLAFLMIARLIAPILVFVSLFALGVAFVTPALASMASKGGDGNVGKALGQLTAANSLGQTGGPIAGGILIGWQVHFPYLLTSLVLGMAAFYALIFIRQSAGDSSIPES